MSIEPIGSVDAGSTSVMSIQQLYEVAPSERRLAAVRQQDDLSVLTAGDREFLAAVFGPQVVAARPLSPPASDDRLDQALDRAQAVNRIEDQALDQARLANQAQQDALAEAQELRQTQNEARIEDQNRADQFVADLVADRRDGRLPVGTEITSSYVQARFDAYGDINGTVPNPLTQQNIIDARAYFNDRVQGAAIDLQA